MWELDCGTGDRTPVAVVDPPAALDQLRKASIFSELLVNGAEPAFIGAFAPDPAGQCFDRDFPPRRLAQQDGGIAAVARAAFQAFKPRAVRRAAEPPALAGDRRAQRHLVGRPVLDPLDPAAAALASVRQRDPAGQRPGWQAR